MTTGPTPKTFQGTSVLGSYADSYRHSWAFRFFEDLGLSGVDIDSLSFNKQDIPKTANLPVDGMQNLLDQLGIGRGDGYTDDFNAWLDSFAFTKNDIPKVVDLPQDPLGSYSDALGHSWDFIFSDDANLWLDSIGISQQKLVELRDSTIVAGSGYI